MAHPLVEQLRFTRAEWLRGLRGVKEAEALRRFEPLNSIGWIVGHLAWQEQRYWLTRTRGVTPHPELNDLVASGGPPSTPSLHAMGAAWRDVTAAVDPWLDGLPRPTLPPACRVRHRALSATRSIGSRTTTGSTSERSRPSASRLGHARLPQFVGDLEGQAPYRTG